MKNLQKGLIAAFFLALMLVFCLFSKQEEQSSMEQITHYANGPMLSFSIEESMLHIETASSVPSGAKVHYTLDGSLPTLNSPCYTEPIAATCDWDHLCVVRAAVFYNDEWSEIFTQTLVPEGSLPAGMHWISLITDPFNLYDYETGIMVEGKTKDDFIAAGGDYDALPVWKKPANFAERGDEWVRDANFELFDTDGKRLFSQQIGLSVSGNASAYYDVKSFKLNGKDIPAELLAFEYPAETAYSQAADFNKLSVKNGGQDRMGTFLVSRVIYPLANESGLLATPACEPCVVYLNGDFYSYMYLQPHINRGYLADAFNLDKDEIEWDELSENRLRNDIGFDGENDLQKLENAVDMDNLLLYYAFEMAVNNRDSMANNYGLWRYIGEEKPDQPYTDGKYRFVLYDVDTCLRRGEMFETLLDWQSESYSQILNLVLSDEKYREKFVNICLNLIQSTLSPDQLRESLTKERDLLNFYCEEPIGKQVSKTFAERDDNMYQMIFDNAVERKSVVIDQLRKYFNLRSLYELQVNVDAEGCYAALENLKITHAQPYSGEYFYSNNLHLTAKVGESRTFSHWLVNGERYDDPVLYLSTDYLQLYDIVEITMVTEPLPHGKLIISAISAKGDNDWIKLKNVGTEPVKLGALHISNSKKNPYECRLPDKTLQPNEEITLYCRNNMTLLGFQTNFNLSSGETITINDSGANTIAKLTVPKMSTQTAYGISPQTGELVFFPQ